jgi:hypothetical protein
LHNASSFRQIKAWTAATAIVAMICPSTQPDVTHKTPLALFGTEPSLIEFSSDESSDEDEIVYLSSSLSTL